MHGVLNIRETSVAAPMLETLTIALTAGDLDRGIGGDSRDALVTPLVPTAALDIVEGGVR